LRVVPPGILGVVEAAQVGELRHPGGEAEQRGAERVDELLKIEIISN